MTDTYERCSCGRRDRANCSKESLSGGGKMCVKEMKSKDENGYPHWDATIFYPEGFVVRWSDGEHALVFSRGREIKCIVCT